MDFALCPRFTGTMYLSALYSTPSRKGSTEEREMAVTKIRMMSGKLAFRYVCDQHGYVVVRKTRPAIDQAERLHRTVSHSGATPIEAVEG